MKRHRTSGASNSSSRKNEKRKLKRTSHSSNRHLDSQDDVDVLSSGDDSTQVASTQFQSRQINENVENEEEDSALDFTQPEYMQEILASQRSNSQASTLVSSSQRKNIIPGSIAHLSPKAIDDLTSLLVRYILYKAGLKLPIRFSDISKEVYSKYKNVSRYFFQRACKEIDEVFGYTVISADQCPSSANLHSFKDVYIVINKITSQGHLQHIQNNNGTNPHRGLLMMILGLLWCAPGRRLCDEVLWKQLGLVDSSIVDGREHTQLGDIAQLLKNFEKQLYLYTSTEVDADHKKLRFYTFGPRAYLEVRKENIFNFVCKIITHRSPTKRQFNEILDDV